MSDVMPSMEVIETGAAAGARWRSVAAGWLSHFRCSPAVTRSEGFRISVGAMIGILTTGIVSHLALGGTDGMPVLVGPMGASAVLLFAVPNSPLARPWSILGGNTLSALIGVTCAFLIPSLYLAAAVGVAASIGAMLALRCLHPPGGAMALTVVMGGPAVHAAGYGFALWPVGLNSALLLVSALAFNRWFAARID